MLLPACCTSNFILFCPPRPRPPLLCHIPLPLFFSSLFLSSIPIASPCIHTPPSTTTVQEHSLPDYSHTQEIKTTRHKTKTHNHTPHSHTLSLQNKTRLPESLRKRPTQTPSYSFLGTTSTTMSNGDQQNDKPNYYELLDLEPGASKDDVRKAYRKQALLFHPDKMKPHMKEEASQHFQLISEAYDVLFDGTLPYLSLLSLFFFVVSVLLPGAHTLDC